MMSLEAIRQVNNDVARQAARKGRRPYVPSDPDDVRQGKLKIPNLGPHVPAGWARVTEGYQGEGVWFVDKSGFGGDGWALDQDVFLRRLADYCEANPTHGYAMFEEGEFQCYVAAYRPTK